MTVRRLLALGLRPFYLLAALLAAAAIPLWLAAFTGRMQLGNALPGVFWHSHEMVFGFLAAVFTGFLFTAVRNWTGRPTPDGWMLGLIALVWIVPRVMLVTGPVAAAVAIDVIFLPLVTVAIAIPIFGSRNRRNYKIVGVIAIISVLHFLFHLALAGALATWLARSSVFASIDVVMILFATVGGRVIPAFTRNAVPGSNPIHKPWVEVSAFGLLILVALMTMLGSYLNLATRVPALLLFLAGAAHSYRLALWQPQLTVGNPLLWMMPVAYSWLPVAMLLRGLAQLSIISPAAWIHALTMGALSSLMLAMMMRSALGHTGRRLVASRKDMSAFLLLQLAAILRVVAGLLGSQEVLLFASGAAWTLAFGVFLFRYLPMLTQARVDGRPG